MKLTSGGLTVLLSVIGLAEVVDGLCLVRNTTNPNYYWYQCFMSTDYSADLKKAPVDIKGHSVTSSKIQVVRNGSFARWGKTLESLGILFCGVQEIEDNAFEGLTHLEDLILAGNELEVIKSAWVEGLSQLRMLSFQNNRIIHVDDDFFSILPQSLNTLDIPNNRLTCLPTASFGNFNVSEFNFRNNRLTWKCQVEAMKLLENSRIEEDSLRDSSMDPPFALAEICISKLPQSEKGRELLDKCVEDKTHAFLLFRHDYTVGEVCEYLKHKPSLFLNCTK